VSPYEPLDIEQLPNLIVKTRQGGRIDGFVDQTTANRTMAKRLNRRQFLAGSAALGGAMSVGLGAPLVLRAAPTDRWGDLVGRLVYDGPPPLRKRLKVDKDLVCCGKFDIRDESLMVDRQHGLANVYVFLRTRKVAISQELTESAPKQVLLDNRGCIFQPHCMKIWVGKQEYKIVNSDPVAQNVTFSPPGDAPADIVMPVGFETTWKFQRKQNVPVPIACHYHPWESALVLPREDPYVDISAPDGTFKIGKLPVGKLEFQFWHERLGPVDIPRWPHGRFEITLAPGVNDLGTIKLSPAMFERKA